MSVGEGDPTEDGRAIDRSIPEHTGSPKEMRAICLECGHVTRGGCVTVWLEIEDGQSNPRDDVSYKCFKGCGEVTDHRIEIVSRWPG